MFIFLTKVIIEQENLNLEENISCLGLRVLTVGKMPLVFSHLFSSLVIPLNSLVLTITSRKKKNPKLYFQLSFLKNAAPFPTIPWTRCLGHPSPAIPPPPTHSRLKYTRSTGKSLSPHCSYPHTGSSFVTNYHSVYHHHHRHHPYPRRQAQNHGASSSHQLPWPVSTALPVPVIWAQPCLITC